MMKRVGPRAIIISSNDLRKYGWTFEKQVSNNPESKKFLKDLRAKQAQELYKARTNAHVNRFRKTRNPKELDSARYTQGKEGPHESE